MSRVHERLLHLENVIHHQLVSHSIVVLRVAVGAVFLGFGVLKYFPGVSPAENLTMATTDLLTFGLVPGGVSIVAIATLECVIGVSLISGRGMRVAIWLLGIQFVGILSPIVLLPDRLFAGLHGAPTLEGQYVLKDVILVAAGMVIAAATFRGGRMVRADLPPAARIRAMAPLDSEQKLRLVLQGAGDPARFAELSERHGIPETELHDWRAIARSGAERALADSFPASGPSAGPSERALPDQSSANGASVVHAQERRPLAQASRRGTRVAYDPRSETGIPTEPVGSLPRPHRLQAAYAQYDAGDIEAQQLWAEQDAAVKDSIERMEATGSPIVSDGEQRWSSFATYPLTDTLGGSGMADHLGGGGQYFAIFADGHNRRLPKLTGGPFKYRTYAGDTFTLSRPFASKPMKQAVIAPSMLALLYPWNEDIPGYPYDQFAADLCDECEKDIRGVFDAGAERVSIDFTEGRLATRDDPRNPWTGAGMLPHFIELNNRVIDRFTADERARIGIHTCPGGDRDSVHSADVPYTNLLPELFKLNAGYFLIQLASERDKDPVYESIGRHSRDDADGVAQMCYIGVTVTQSPRAESPQEVCDMLVRAADFIPKERLGSTDDCGFSPFSIDEKPNHGSPDYAREIAFAKIAARVEGTKMAADKFDIRISASAGSASAPDRIAG